MSSLPASVSVPVVPHLVGPASIREWWIEAQAAGYVEDGETPERARELAEVAYENSTDDTED